MEKSQNQFQKKKPMLILQEQDELQNRIDMLKEKLSAKKKMDLELDQFNDGSTLHEEDVVSQYIDTKNPSSKKQPQQKHQVGKVPVRNGISKDKQKSIQNGQVKKGLQKRVLPEFKSIEITKMGYIEPVSMKRSNQKYQVAFWWRKKGDTQPARKVTKRFGKKGTWDYVDAKPDDKDDLKRISRINRLKQTHNPLHQNFWLANLLNGPYNKLGDAYEAVRSSLNQSL